MDRSGVAHGIVPFSLWFVPVGGKGGGCYLYPVRDVWTGEAT